MHRLIVLGVLVAAALLAGTNAFAGDWALTLDTPLSYTFDNDKTNKQAPQNNGYSQLDSRTTSDVSGSRVALIAPFHVGIGYEDYTVKQNITIGPSCGAPNCGGKVALNIRMLDVLLDIPMKYLNLTLGYGQGDVRADVELPSVIGPGLALRNLNVTQTFLVAGIPLGKRWDVHVGYYWVSIEPKDVLGSSGTSYDQLQVSGTMLSAGARLNF